MLYILSGCIDNGYINSTLTTNQIEITTTTEVSPFVATTENENNAESPLDRAINVVQPYLEKGGILYDLNNDNYPEMIKVSEPYNHYFYSVYDLSTEEPLLLGEFFTNDDTNGSTCKIYKCYDNKNSEYFYVTEEVFYMIGYTESYIKKIKTCSNDVLYSTIMSKRTFYDDNQSFYIINDGGNIVTGHSDEETAISYFKKQYEVLSIFTIGESLYDKREFSLQPTFQNKSTANDINKNNVEYCNITAYDLGIYNNEDLQKISNLNEHNNLNELSIIDESGLIDDYSFLCSLKNIQLLEVKSEKSSNLRDMIFYMTNLQYLNYSVTEKYNSLTFLKNCNNLGVLYLGNGVQSDVISAYEILYSMQNLKVIAFSGQYNFVTDAQIKDIKQNMPNCMIVQIK